MTAYLCLRGVLYSEIKQITNIPIGIYKPPILTFLILLCFVFAAKAQEVEVRSTPVADAEILTGTVSSVKGNVPLEGATLKIKGTNITTITNADGEFRIPHPLKEGIIITSFLGYMSKEVPFTDKTRSLLITLESNLGMLEEVQINTGYQHIPKERSTGSFSFVDNALLNRSVSTNILDRLDGVTSGLQFRSSGPSIDSHNPSLIQIRGRSTLTGGHQALIIVDNFAFDGDISTINPNDIENVTILKDAAAASAWGARAGNGVIVITTKKGRFNEKNKVSFNSNLSIGEKPDLYSQGTPQLSSSEYIEVEQFLFDKGAYNTRIQNRYQGLSPAVEIFLQARNGTISSFDSLEMINRLKLKDSRAQLLKYYYRNSINQQYNVNFSGGGTSNTYYVSGGYDRNKGDIANQFRERLSFNANNSYFFFNKKLEVVSNLVFSSNKSGNGVQVSNLYPYDELADAEGRALAITSADGLRVNYTDTAGYGKLLDWKNRPLDELNRGALNKTNLTNYRLNLAIKYNITSGLRASIRYGLEKGVDENKVLNDIASFYTRNLLNTYSQIDPVTGNITYGMPLGGILNQTTNVIKSDNGRFQLDYSNIWGNHAINAIIGSEIKDFQTSRSGIIYYGYDESTRVNQNAAIDYTVSQPYFYRSGGSRINTGLSQYSATDRFLSYYINASYNYAEKYTASLSARRDESNLFGVKTNQKGVPLWSAGAAWAISKEDFYNLEWLPKLKVRTTYGYTGNVDKSISAYLTANSASYQINLYNSLYATIINPPNPSLRWEKVRNFDLGLDFGVLNDRISGSIDYWHKSGEDLIGLSPIAPQTGVSSFKGNTASTTSRGWDIELNTVNLNGVFKWYTTLLFNNSKDKVTEYLMKSGTNYSIISSPNANPLVGYPYWAMYSFKYKGLDNKGNPIGYLNGKESDQYSAIANNTNRDDMVFSGSRIPTVFGTMRHTFIYRGLELSVNIGYKFGYVFRRYSLNNSTLYGNGGNVGELQFDYGKQWQVSGDELITNIPSVIYPAESFRTIMYTYSDGLVESGNNIRLQDLRLGYTFSGILLFPKNLTVFAYANNLGIIWKKNRLGVDPDAYNSYPQPRTFSLGINASF